MAVVAGLGLFEYMQLAEELGAEPVWVVNNGLSHSESVPAGRIQPWVQDALDSVECVRILLAPAVSFPDCAALAFAPVSIALSAVPETPKG